MQRGVAGGAVCTSTAVTTKATLPVVDRRRVDTTAQTSSVSSWVAGRVAGAKRGLPTPTIPIYASCAGVWMAAELDVADVIEPQGQDAWHISVADFIDAMRGRCGQLKPTLMDQSVRAAHAPMNRAASVGWNRH
jgi:hypothetical protein